MRAVAVLSMLCLAGCAFGQRYETRRTFAVSPQASIPNGSVIAVKDSRPYVVSGDKDATFLGYMRSLYGIPYPVHTASGEPFADDLATSIVSSVATTGSAITRATLPSQSSKEQIIRKLTGDDPQRAILLNVTEWKSDTYITVGLYYDVTVSVFDGRGALLAEESFAGQEDFGRQYGDDAMGLAYALVLNRALNDSSIAASLRPSAKAIAEAPTRAESSSDPAGDCSVEQILAMKRAGLTDSQVQAACQ